MLLQYLMLLNCLANWKPCKEGEGKKSTLKVLSFFTCFSEVLHSSICSRFTTCDSGNQGIE